MPTSTSLLFTLLLSVGLIACSPSKNNQAIDFNKAKWVDLSHSYDESNLYWPNNVKGFEHTREFKGQTPGNFFYSSSTISTPEHGGTHLDTPIHFAEKGWTVDQIPLDSLPVTGAYIVALPMKIAGGSGGPLRIVAAIRQD